MKDQRIKGVLYASVTAFFWGFLAIALKMGTNVIDPMTIVWFRFLLAFSVLFIYFLFADKQQLGIIAKPPLILLVAALGLGFNYVGFLKGVDLTTPSTAQVMIQVGPILLGIVGVLFFKEKVNTRQGLGFLVAGVGLVLFYRDNIAKLIGDESSFNQGILWVFFAAVSWVVYATFQKILVRNYNAQQLNLVIFGLPVIIFLPFVDFTALFALSWQNWILMIYLGANTLIAYGSLALAFKYLEANKVSIIITLNPILTFGIMAMMAWAELNWIEFEQITLISVIAAILVVSGAIMAVAFSKKK